MFTTEAPVSATQTRYEVAQSYPTTDGGNVGSGKDRKGTPVLVHTIGRSQSALEMHAVATAIVTGKVIHLPDLVAGFFNAGTLPARVKAIDKFEKDREKAAAAAEKA
jgi:hypothetical protein